MSNHPHVTVSDAHPNPQDENPPPADKDWHRNEIICAIHMTGGSVASLSRAHGLAEGTLANALNRPWPKGELIIANAIGVNPEQIWPSRFLARRERDRFRGRQKRRYP
ncbi:transcriptional regulator [Erwinia sp. E602]|uniref:helix-turn-helix domain-containing protein n=1 Tax=Erwinia sp. E602 TaxID=2675378 RepID=UPI001BAA2928|nr:helix-turn-helix transcriptional regulator [Erwinia sp. E602]QUG76986.1 transcriptional regulator [Erwinia sp. E602]